MSDAIHNEPMNKLLGTNISTQSSLDHNSLNDQIQYQTLKHRTNGPMNVPSIQIRH